MKKLANFLVYILIFVSTLSADEGLWVPVYLKQQGIIDRMRQKGCTLMAEDIYSTQHSSLKDAVVIFGGGCTGEFISPDGLLITNYHCGYSSIQKHSSVEHDYLADGFWAMSRDEELPNPGLTVKITVDMKDVTDEVLKGIDENTPEILRKTLIENNIEKIVAREKSKFGEDYEIIVEPFYSGNQYLLVVYQVFKDVRLVGAPPSSIGKFGGDTDNWMWPRHTGDFSVFRVYAGKDNKPAEYSPDNVPYKPEKFLKISLKGIQPGDFTMVMGYPGSTEEYMPSFYVDWVKNFYNPKRIQIRQLKLDIINQAMRQDKELKIKYAAKQARIANAWKKWIGVNKGLERLKTIEKKREFERKFIAWAKEGNPQYVNLLREYKRFLNLQKNQQLAYYLFIETFYFTDLFKIYKVFVKASAKDADLEKLQKSLENIFKDYDFETEKELFITTLNYYANNVDIYFIPEKINQLRSKGKLSAYTSTIFEKSNLTEFNKASKFLKKIYGKKISDPVFDLFDQMYGEILKERIYDASMENYTLKTDSLQRLYMKAQMQMQPGKIFYPDANFTLRVAFGNVKGYYPKDAVKYLYATTLDGVMEKGQTDIYDYQVPEKLKQLYNSKNFGKYADPDDGKIHIAFIATNHTTGGNSGSPVLDKNGNLIGINFDRVWEGTMSDLDFDPDMCRNIILDIRYVLFIIDKYAGAGYLLNEMQFVE